MNKDIEKLVQEKNQLRVEFKSGKSNSLKLYREKRKEIARKLTQVSQDKLRSK